MDAARPIIMDEIWMYTCIIAFNLAVIFGGFTYVKKKGITCEIHMHCYKMLIGGGLCDNNCGVICKRSTMDSRVSGFP